MPPSYRSFLLIADGADSGGIHASHVLRHVPACEHAQLLRADDVIAFSENDQVARLMGMWRDSASERVDRQTLPSADEPVEVFDFEPGSRALLITAPLQDGIVALVPFQPEWQVWEFFWGKVVAHQSFAAFVGHHARGARREVSERAERIRDAALDGSDWLAVMALADHGDPRAVDTAARVLQHPHHSHDVKGRIARHLMWLGHPDAIPALRTALARSDAPDFASPVEGLSPTAAQNNRRRLDWELIEALDVCGDPTIVRELQQLAEGDSALSKKATDYLAKRDQLPRW